MASAPRAPEEAGGAPGTGSAPGRSKRSSSHRVAAEIRALIQNESLEPGDRLGREEDLARRFGVSRPTLREALRVLSSAHLVRASKGPGGGIFVAGTIEQGLGMSVSESIASMLETDSIGIDELLETRIIFEVPLAGLAAQRARPEDVAALQELVADSDLDDLAHVAKADLRLHRKLAEMAGNRLAQAFMEWVAEVQPSLHELIAPAVVEAVLVDQLRDIVRAIARGDPRQAERAMRDHLVYVSDVVAAVTRVAADHHVERGR